MCGIVGISGSKKVTERLVHGLSLLEYRGYDSAGVATLNGNGIERRRSAGKLSNLEALLETSPIDGLTGIAHTRWATHGKPTESNAHPHFGAKCAIVHNGIIENFQALRAELGDLGVDFESETDSETIAKMLGQFLDQGDTPAIAFDKMVAKLHGAYSIAAIFDGHDGLIIATRQGSPLVLGIGEEETYIGSDAIALSPLTNQVVYLEEGDVVELNNESYALKDKSGFPANRPVKTSQAKQGVIDLGNYRHYMQKEIFEQPEATTRSLSAFIDTESLEIDLGAAAEIFKDCEGMVCIACGTAYYAGAIAKYWFEGLAGLPFETDIASEFRYRQPALPKNGAALFISQSGETADTYAALKYCNNKGLDSLGIINVPESTIARECDHVLQTQAGPEIGVASTKAFTSQLAVLAAMAIAAGRARGTLSEDRAKALLSELLATPRLMGEALKQDNDIRELARHFVDVRDVLYLGRGVNYPLALEGALKLKEISYIHAEGYAAGELKHGPIALVEDGTPIIVVAPDDELFEKTISNVEEVKARGAKIFLISDAKGLEKAASKADYTMEVPTVDPVIAPLVVSLPLQMLAYHIADLRGADVDKPRNLAKSVTVE